MSTAEGTASISINYQEYENMNMSNTNSVDTLLTISAEAADMRRRRTFSLTCWVHARRFAKGVRSTWVLTTSSTHVLIQWALCGLSESIQKFS